MPAMAVRSSRVTLREDRASVDPSAAAGSCLAGRGAAGAEDGGFGSGWAGLRMGVTSARSRSA
jgi:hypothetical protein